MFEPGAPAAPAVEEPPGAGVPRPRAGGPHDRVERLRAALAGPPGPELAAAVAEAREPAMLAWLGEPGMVDLISAGHRLTAWGESVRLDGLEALWRSRRRLGHRDLEQLSSVGDAQELAAAARALLAGADDLAGRSVVAEAAAVCGVSEYSQGRRLDAALELTRLPDTHEALRTGLVDWPKAQSVAEAVRGLTDVQAATVEARCLPGASRQSTRGLQHALDRAVMEAAPEEAARRHQAGKAFRGVSFRMGRDRSGTDGLPDGTGELTARMSAAELLDFRRNLDLLADAARTEDDHRTLNQRRIDVLYDLLANGVTRVSSGESSGEPDSDPTEQPTEQPTESRSGPSARIDDSVLPAPGGAGRSEAPAPHIVVLVGLDTLLGHDQCAGELLGYGPIPAAVVRDLATRGVWRCAVTDEHGTVLGLGRSTFTPSYRPPGATARLVRLRDRTCVFPGCRRQARLCDLDHRTPHRAGGATCECNLQALCGHHHRLKHEAGFRVRVSDDPDHPPGSLDWTTPTGRHVPRYPVTAGRPRRPDEPPF